MKSNRDGVFVPRRVIFIMILVSLFINVFFLLMGILIGKEDLKWTRQSQDDAPTVQEVKTGAVDRAEVESDLSVFDDQDNDRQTEPVDVTYLDTGLPDKTDGGRKETVKEPEPTPTAESEKKEPEKIAIPSPDTGASGYWVQVLATTEQPKAKDFREKLAANGYRATVVFEGRYHKVQVGPFSEKIAAEAVSREIEQAFKTKGWVRKK